MGAKERVEEGEGKRESESLQMSKIAICEICYLRDVLILGRPSETKEECLKGRKHSMSTLDQAKTSGRNIFYFICFISLCSNTAEVVR